MAAVPSIGRADRGVAPEAELTQALYQRHATQIFRYCQHQLGSREEAEDAVQSTFLNAFRSLDRFEEAFSLMTRRTPGRDAIRVALRLG